MGGVAGRYHSEAEHLLTELPRLVELLKGKEWARARALLEMRQAEATATAKPALTVSEEPPRGSCWSRPSRPRHAGFFPEGASRRRRPRGHLFPGLKRHCQRRAESRRPSRSREANRARPRGPNRALRAPRRPSHRSAGGLLPAERIGIDGAGYPDRLGSIPSPPKALWVRGSLPPVTAVAIVGTRHPTPSGCDLAEFAARSAVRAGFGVVSGLAAGIDTVAHKSALAAGGRTWAVLGSGVDLPTPAANFVLAEEIISAGGGLISELPLGTPVSPHGLVARDRIQSGLSLAVVVCQCEISSGAMQTARFAAVQGRLLLVARPNVSELEHPSWRGKPRPQRSRWLRPESFRGHRHGRGAGQSPASHGRHCARAPRGAGSVLAGTPTQLAPR